MLSLYEPTKTRKSVAINHHIEPYILGNYEEPSAENRKSVLSSLTRRSATQPLSSCWCDQEEKALGKCHRDKKGTKEDLKQCDVLQMKLLRCNKERANKCAASRLEHAQETE